VLLFLVVVVAFFFFLDVAFADAEFGGGWFGLALACWPLPL
jgi:hypothetical protein